MNKELFEEPVYKAVFFSEKDSFLCASGSSTETPSNATETQQGS